VASKGFRVHRRTPGEPASTRTDREWPRFAVGVPESPSRWRPPIVVRNESDPGLRGEAGPSTRPVVPILKVSKYEGAVLEALRAGARERTEVLTSARVQLGKVRLGPAIRRSLEDSVGSLQMRRLVTIEDSELFLTQESRTASLAVSAPARAGGRRYWRNGRYHRRRS